MDRIDAMKIFVTAVDEGSLAGAARRLRRSPTAISRAIASLEAHVGAELLHRTTRSIRLSETGEHYAASWLPFIGIAYDPKNDLIEVALEGLDHMIRKPQEVYVDHEVGSLISLQIVNSDGVREIIKLKDPISLPAPQEAT